MKVGLNLYSIRNQISTKEDMINTLIRLKEMGYDYIQFSGVPFNKELIKEVSEKSDLPVVLTHVPVSLALENPEQLVKDHKEFGCENIGLGFMEFRHLSEDAIYGNIEKIKTATENVVKAGGRYFYHNHNHEFLKTADGVRIFDKLIEIKDLNFTLDTFWLQAGGVSITDYVERLKGRIDCVHLKDYMPTFNEGEPFSAKFVPVGDGNINFNKVIEKMKQAGVKYYLVEQDDATNYSDPFEQVEKSVKYLKENF